MDPSSASTHPPPSAAPSPVLPVVAGVAAFLALQYAFALHDLGRTSGEMMNKFSKLAREEYLGFLIRQNLLMLLAYAVLAVAASFLIRPWIGWLTRLRGLRWRGGAVVAAFLCAQLLHFFFTLRLIKTRPYFLNEAEFGHWYYKAIDFIPEPVKPATLLLLFTVLPVGVLIFAIGWHFKRLGHRARIGVAILALAAVALAAWQARGPAARPPAAARTDLPNILIIGSDSLRGDMLGCAGYRPARSDGLAAAGVSPHIDALAATAIRFENAYTPIASTIESGASLMASLYPHGHGLRHMYSDRATVETANRTVEPLADILRPLGYDTAAIGDWCAGYYHVTPLGFEHISVSDYDNFKIYMSQAVVMAHFVVPLYFDNPLGYRMFPQIQSFAQFVTPKVVTDRVTRRLEAAARDRRPFFWHVFYSCNHLPYRSREPYVSMFADPAYQGPNRTGVDFDIDQFIGGTDLESKWRALPEPEVRQIRALYDGCTRLFDDCVGKILAALRENGLDHNTIVIITSDHGDDLYEPNVTLGHGLTLNGADHSFHVPLIIRLPGAEPRVIPEAVRLIDVAPTLAELAGAPVPAAWQGASFAGWLRGTETPAQRPVYAETGFPFIQFQVPGVERPPLPPMDQMTFIDESFDYHFVLLPEFHDRIVAAKQRCLRTRDWKIVCTPTAAGGRHFGLFHTAADPNCEHDLAAARPEVLAPLRAALERWIDHHAETPIHEIFPGGEPGR